MKKLLYSFLICSGNDAGIAIAEHIAGSVDKFAAMMNKEVKALGCSGSNFVNPHGLHDDNHYTTPYDLYLVFHELLKYDVFMDIINHLHTRQSLTEQMEIKKHYGLLRQINTFLEVLRLLRG